MAGFDWQSELKLEHGLTRFKSAPRLVHPVPEAPPEPEPPAEKPWKPGELPRSQAHYQELLHAAFDGPKARLMAALAEDRLLHRAVREWEPKLGFKRSNVPVFNAVFSRVNALIGESYGFAPAWLGQPPEPLPEGVLGAYQAKHDLLYLSAEAMGEDMGLLVMVIVHEQMHAFQHHMTERAFGDYGLPLVVRSICHYWYREFQRNQFDVNYHGLGTEYHANDVGYEAWFTVLGLQR